VGWEWLVLIRLKLGVAYEEFVRNIGADDERSQNHPIGLADGLQFGSGILFSHVGFFLSFKLGGLEVPLTYYICDPFKVKFS
jgi:hypothetical protein